MPEPTILDQVATDLAVWLDEVSSQIALAMAPQGVAPFAAPLSETQKLEYYRNALFNPDGSPNLAGRAQEMQRLGPQSFRTVYQAVIKAYPYLRVPSPPEAAVPQPSPPTQAGPEV